MVMGWPSWPVHMSSAATPQCQVIFQASAMMSLFSRTKRLLLNILINPDFFWILVAIVLVGDVILTQLVIRFIPCVPAYA